MPNALYDKALFYRKLTELGINGPLTEQVMAPLADQFTLDDLEHTIQNVVRQQPGPSARVRADRPHDGDAGQGQLRDPLRPRAWTSPSGSSSRPRPPRPTGSRTPASSGSPTTTAGSRYYATYTAYDGRVTLPQLLETEDFLHFKVSTLNGPEVRNKGFALFPRKINGHYAMLSRQDNENIYLMYSDMPHFWYTKELIAKPTYSVGVRSARQLRLADRDRGRLARADPRRRSDAEVLHGRVPARPPRSIARDRPAARRRSWSPTPTSARATCRTSSIAAAPCRTVAT